MNREHRIYKGDSLIIHIHGGGFIALDSNDHQSYLRSWANKTQVPVFSIDYRLAPEFPFPLALDDVWQGYKYLVENVEKLYGIRLEKIESKASYLQGGFIDNPYSWRWIHREEINFN